jgi:hypothetical protein
MRNSSRYTLRSEPRMQSRNAYHSAMMFGGDIQHTWIKMLLLKPEEKSTLDTYA